MPTESRTFRRILEQACNLPREVESIDHFISRDLYGVHAVGLTGPEIEQIEAAAQARRPATREQKIAAYNKHLDLDKHAAKALRQYGVQPRLRGLLPDRPRHLPSPEVRKARRERRYGLERGKCGVLVPPNISAGLTPSDVAVLTVVGIEIIQKGSCDLYVAQIGHLAGCGERTARLALRHGEKLGLINTVHRREGRFNKTNIVMATPHWSPWLKRRQAWKINRRFSADDLKSRLKKEKEEDEKGSARMQGVGFVPSLRPVEAPRKPVIITDLRSARQKAEDGARFERWRAELPRR